MRMNDKFDVEQFRRGLRPVRNLAAEAAKAQSEGDELCCLRVSGSYAEADFSGLDFDRVLFENCRVHEMFVQWLLFPYGGIRGFRHQQLRLRGSAVHRLRISRRQRSGNGIYRQPFRKNTVRQLRHVLCEFRPLPDGECRLDASDFSDASFSEAEFREPALRESVFVRTDFFRTPLRGIDFTTCRLEGLTLSETASELRGAVVGAGQAIELAKMFGLIVR